MKNKSKYLPKFSSIEEIFNTTLSLNEKVELASEYAMFRVNEVIEQNLFKYRNGNPVSVKYEDTDLYRLEQKSKAKRELERKLKSYSTEEINTMLYHIFK